MPRGRMVAHFFTRIESHQLSVRLPKRALSLHAKTGMGGVKEKSTGPARSPATHFTDLLMHPRPHPFIACHPSSYLFALIQKRPWVPWSWLSRYSLHKKYTTVEMK
ncbi:hypothetical protein TIFTF001_055528 [Ficus carica]|uniref:Uncharacterized protein n=1 Tax=Ficus carica TaxID=3494 RepID=A0AA88JC53_FICCA|nr:hypothetical protein TIFTF001_055528 [Ficus carica]